MSKISRLNELNEMVRVEKIRIADEVCAELRTGTLEIENFSAVQALEIAKADRDAAIFYWEEMKEEALYGWDGLWTSSNENKLKELNKDYKLICDALELAKVSLEAKIPF